MKNVINIKPGMVFESTDKRRPKRIIVDDVTKDNPAYALCRVKRPKDKSYKDVTWIMLSRLNPSSHWKRVR